MLCMQAAPLFPVFTLPAPPPNAAIPESFAGALAGLQAFFAHLSEDVLSPSGASGAQQALAAVPADVQQVTQGATNQLGMVGAAVDTTVLGTVSDAQHSAQGLLARIPLG
jgi:hypothetical protein